MSASNHLSWQFDDAAQLNAEVRPRYPEEIVEHIIACAALSAQGRVFEVGCGTGQMTLPCARRGYTVVALDQRELQRHVLADAHRRERTTSSGTRACVLPLRC